MHDHSHEPVPDQSHDFGPLTDYERSLFYRSQLLHVATEIFKSGVPNNYSYTASAHYTPTEAVRIAVELIAQVDNDILSKRVETGADPDGG